MMLLGQSILRRLKMGLLHEASSEVIWPLYAGKRTIYGLS